MSEQTAERRESAAARKAREAREAAERAAAAQSDKSGDGAATPEDSGPSLEALAKLDENDPELTDDQRAAFAKLTDDQREEIATIREIASIEGFTVTEDTELQTAATPIRNRKPPQKAMDRVAARAYQDWIGKGRPTTWSRLPVITYFLTPEEAAEYRKMIRAAVKIVPAESYDKDGKKIEPTGVRARFGNDFVLSEKMAKKIGKPDEAGKTVLQWAAVDKRHVGNGKNDGEDGD